MRRIKGLIIALCGLVLAVPVTAAAAGPSSAYPQFHPPAHTYLALGDSLAFGWHDFVCDTSVNRTGCSGSLFQDGYANDFQTLMQQVKPGISLVNYACPGETSGSMLGLGTPGYPSSLVNCLARYAGQPLHDSYPLAQSQMGAALAFLANHRRDTSPITLDLGANDLIDMIRACYFDGACVVSRLPAVVTRFTTNLDTILTELHDAAPTAEIVFMNVPDVFEFVAPSTIPIFQHFADATSAVLAAHRNVRLVDAFGYVLSMYTGSQPAGLQQFCGFDAFCSTNPPDIHPTAGGYAAMAQMFFQVSGYARMVG